MEPHDERQWNKLNDLLSNSFNNVKYDVRDVRSQIDKLRAVFAHISADTIKKSLEYQNRLVSDIHQSLNLLNQRVNALEKAKSEPRLAPQPQSVVLQTVSKATESKPKKSAGSDKSIYDFGEGEVRITKVQFKSKKNGKKNLNGEWVEICAYGGFDMTSYKLYDKGRKHTFKFPDNFKVYGPVKIFTGKGRNTNTRLYWKQPRPVWNDSGDVASLADRKNRVVSQVISEPTFSFKVLK